MSDIINKADDYSNLTEEQAVKAVFSYPPVYLELPEHLQNNFNVAVKVSKYDTEMYLKVPFSLRRNKDFTVAIFEGYFDGAELAKIVKMLPKTHYKSKKVALAVAKHFPNEVLESFVGNPMNSPKVAIQLINHPFTSKRNILNHFTVEVRRKKEVASMAVCADKSNWDAVPFNAVARKDGTLLQAIYNRSLATYFDLIDDPWPDAFLPKEKEFIGKVDSTKVNDDDFYVKQLNGIVHNWTMIKLKTKEFMVIAEHCVENLSVERLNEIDTSNEDLNVMIKRKQLLAIQQAEDSVETTKKKRTLIKGF